MKFLKIFVGVIYSEFNFNLDETGLIDEEENGKDKEIK